MGLRPGATLEVLRRGRPGGILHLSCGVLEFMLRRDQAALISVSTLA
jgi:ferrous iron transport protein A